MSRVYVLVEGQTEEAFVNELLAPHYARIELYLTPIIVSTSAAQKGGVVSYAKVRPQIERLCKQDADAYVTTMFDLYALPPTSQARPLPRTRGAERGDRRLSSWRASWPRILATATSLRIFSCMSSSRCCSST